MKNDGPILELKNIKKSFGPIQVLNGIDITLNRGEVLGLVGENGAGKSTLIKIICGIYNMTSGEMYFDGKRVDVQSVEQSQKLGISTIYQELSLMPDLNAAENIFINREIIRGGKSLIFPLNARQMREKAQAILHDELHIHIPVDEPLRYMTLAQKQMVEVARTVYADAQVIIMDEPTAALGAAERAQLFDVIRSLKKKGRSVIFISHHLDEIISVCDKVVVLRDGKKVADDTVDKFSVDRIIEEMVGKPLQAQYPKENVEIGESILSVSNLNRAGSFRNVSFDLREGEILGIVGVEGCGKNEVVRSIFGRTSFDSGEIVKNGKKLRVRTVKDAMKNRIAFVPAERKVDGIFGTQDIKWNMTIASLYNIEKFHTLISKKEKVISDRYMKQLRVKAESIDQNITFLSGGNQQKVMLARWVMMDPDVFLLEEPTRGIDVNAKTEVYRAIGDCVKRKKSVIVVSSEEEEVIGICDRIIVMRKGEISAILDAKKANVAEIKRYSLKSGE